MIQFLNSNKNQEKNEKDKFIKTSSFLKVKQSIKRKKKDSVGRKC